ncbi:UvrD-helicase domain-containing protein [Burkholderia aenigmatica]|uniref:UvrD-helicase domain-containing protein n=1 Tax=Burkholderia aenigmatica TaxID=2015348 RepID=UPI00264E72A9|nr:UvrD-helicase domain-containing protein [Burkholderia aenigmatica]MDN7878729.1 UvrD-helicase domain-containing protein [Burkholderia aenigmatica]
MHPTITRFLARLIRSHIDQEKTISHDAGFDEADSIRKSEIEGLAGEHNKLVEQERATIRQLQADLDESRRRENTWEIRDHRKISDIEYDDAIYGPDTFPVTTERDAKMRAEVAIAVEQGKISPPTVDQWKMILSNHPATCVVAGAGSGKSTTLVLRVVFMICHLKIRPREMTVVSFTKDSCVELRKKILNALSIDVWKSQMHPDDAGKLEEISHDLVRTFHSALSRIARRQFPGVKWFDFLDNKGSDLPDDDDFDNPIAQASNLSERQMEMLLDAYRTTFSEDARFREHIAHLIKIECDRDLLSEEPEKDRRGDILKIASARDLELVTRTNEKWKDTGWIMPGIDPTPFVAFKADGHSFYANGRVESTGMPIFLSINGHLNERPLFAKEDSVGKGTDKFPILGALRVRRDIIAKFYGGNKLDIRTTKSIDRLATRVKYIAATDFAYQEAPRFEIQLSGDIGKSDLVEAFYSQASFIENLSMEVPEALAGLDPFKQHSIEYHFASALARFWPRFEALLHNQPTPVMTFNRAFLLLGESHSHRPLNVSPEVLRPFTHLLVDEFQDISPQIVSWLRATQKRLSIAGGTPTIMAIGDDWQSIYGWRGSAPELFIRFNHHFPSSAVLNGAYICQMMENYRSVAPVVADAEKLLKKVAVKIDKRAKAMRPTEASDHGVVMVTGIDFSANANPVINAIHEQLSFVDSLATSDKNKVIVLSRSRRILGTLTDKAGGTPGVAFHTFHGSKGLQGEVAILCDNCDYDMKHVFRNAVYKASGQFSQTYDEAAKDEALRLAYVAITRGVRRVIWFLDRPIGAATLLVP